MTISQKRNKDGGPQSAGNQGAYAHHQLAEAGGLAAPAMTHEQFREMASTTDRQLGDLYFRRFRQTEYLAGTRKTLARNLSPSHRSQLEEHQTEYLAAIKELQSKIDPLEETYDEHQWTRFIAVPNGHMHREFGCHTLRWNTDTRLMAEFSGAEEDELVELAGEFCCTHCYPGAPVNKTSMLPMHVKERADAEALAAEKDAKRAAKMLKAADPTSKDGEFRSNGQWYKTVTGMINDARRHLESAIIYGFNETRSEEHTTNRRLENLGAAWPLVVQAAKRNAENGAKLDTPEALLTDLWTKKAKQLAKDDFVIPDGYDPLTEAPGA